MAIKTTMWVHRTLSDSANEEHHVHLMGPVGLEDGSDIQSGTVRLGLTASQAAQFSLDAEYTVIIRRKRNRADDV